MTTVAEITRRLWPLTSLAQEMAWVILIRRPPPPGETCIIIIIISLSLLKVDIQSARLWLPGPEMAGLGSPIFLSCVHHQARPVKWMPLWWNFSFDWFQHREQKFSFLIKSRGVFWLQFYKGNELGDFAWELPVRLEASVTIILPQNSIAIAKSQ